MTKRISEREAQERLFDMHNGNIVMKNYYSMNDPADFKCLTCNYEWSTKPTGVINRGSGCQRCYFNRIPHNKLSLDDIVERINEKHNGRIKLLEYGGDTHSGSNFECLVCGNIWKSSVHHIFMQVHGCKKCWALEMGKLKSGSNSNWWKGGITLLRPFLKGSLDIWKNDSMISCNYRCIFTGEKDFEIHHTYPLNNIIKDALMELGLERYDFIGDYSEEEMKPIVNKVMEIHYRYPLGICLRRYIHTLFHKLYGRNNCTPQDFYEFAERINSGEIEI